MPSRLDQLNEQRLQKIEALRARGIDPYPAHFHRTHTSQEAVALLERSEKAADLKDLPVTVAGRVMASRGMGKITFMDLRDGTGKIQLLCRKGQPGTQVLEDLDIGDFVGAQGKLFRTRAGEPTVDVAELTMLAKAIQPLPEKWHGLADVEIRYRQRYLDLIANSEIQKLFRTRSQTIAAIRDFLNRRGYLEVETPVLQPLAGGASARPFITHHNALDLDLYLRIALELHLKRLIVGGLDRVYELGRIFRNEGIDTKHNPEFTMLESYEAYADYCDIMDLVEHMVSAAAIQVLGTDEIEYEGHRIKLAPPWKRLDLREAIREHTGIDFMEYPDAPSLLKRMQEMKIEADPNRPWAKLVDDLISAFVQPRLIQPTFLIDYPVAMSPLAKKKPGDERFVERFEAFIGTLELANAFSELNDPVDQRQRFEEQLKERDAENPAAVDEDYVRALEYGMPPTGGLGVGIDRLVMLFTGQPSIREVILFPQMREKG